MKEIPQLQEAEKVRIGMSKRLVLFVRLLLLVDRAIARVLSFQRRCDDQDVIQTRLVITRQNDARNARIDRQLGELASEFRQLVTLVDRSEFKQRFVSVANRCWLRRFQEWK